MLCITKDCHWNVIMVRLSISIYHMNIKWRLSLKNLHPSNTQVSNQNTTCSSTLFTKRRLSYNIIPNKWSQSTNCISHLIVTKTTSPTNLQLKACSILKSPKLLSRQVKLLPAGAKTVNQAKIFWSLALRIVHCWKSFKFSQQTIKQAVVAGIPKNSIVMASTQHSIYMRIQIQDETIVNSPSQSSSGMCREVVWPCCRSDRVNKVKKTTNKCYLSFHKQKHHPHTKSKSIRPNHIEDVSRAMAFVDLETEVKPRFLNHEDPRAWFLTDLEKGTIHELF